MRAVICRDVLHVKMSIQLHFWVIFDRDPSAAAAAARPGRVVKRKRKIPIRQKQGYYIKYFVTSAPIGVW